MPYKCSITREPCRICFDYGAGVSADSCPIGKYKGSSRYLAPGEGAAALIDDTCRYYGIAREAELKTKKFMEG